MLEPPLELAIVTSTAPAVCSGATTVIESGPLPLMGVVEIPSNMTVIGPTLTLEPVNVTCVPPVVGPTLGVTAVNTGAGKAYVNVTAFVCPCGVDNVI